uniref:DNA repair protein complementing XP-C cells homolog isoform X1 n=1 Tax=Rhizophora mucronata TaxID=61149 RepID=A0A2P2LPW8_RHIMU
MTGNQDISSAILFCLLVFYVQAGSGQERKGKEVVNSRVTWNDLDGRSCTRDSVVSVPREVHGASSGYTVRDSNEEMDDIDWEDGSLPVLDSKVSHPVKDNRQITIEFSELPVLAKRKPIHRVTAEDKEVAELVHKVHLLCLLARGRIIDSACDDPLIQASLLSLLPANLCKISEVSKLTANSLSSIVSWFHSNFHVRSLSSENRSFKSALAFALESREGTLEEIAALSVALFRALKLTTRFVSILDVAPIKPDPDRCESSSQDGNSMHAAIFETSTLMVDRANEVFESPIKSFSGNEQTSKVEHRRKDRCSEHERIQSQDSSDVNMKHQTIDPLKSEAQDSIPEIAEKSEGLKRKGDLEFEMQLQMALSATAIAAPQSGTESDVNDLNISSSNVTSSLKRIRTTSEESPSQGISTALGSKKIGSPLFWAEIHCSGENLAGKWVHVDAVNGIIDGEQMVEAAVAACRKSLRYVVAFAGSGAKDVTRRYCMKWHKIASQRIDSVWWDAVLGPLKELEPGAMGGSSGINSFVATRNDLEDMELETRALTEPLPTNQQAYKNHPLYAIERWLTKCQILHPKGPILGFCSGHPVYPRAHVKTLKPKERWLREGLQVKAKELPAKVLKQSGKPKKAHFSDDDEHAKADSKGTIELYGRWQLETLQLPHAVNGIVPKNERGQVEVWSEKCLPPGTVHLRLPRVFRVAKRLGIDYAPAMVGFEFRNGRSFPVFDGIVVCAEFEDAILEAYAEEEERRLAEEKRRNEAQALSRWYQLLSSIITRQRLNNAYGDGFQSESPSNFANKPSIHVDSRDITQSLANQNESMQDFNLDAPFVKLVEEHEHEYLAEDQSFDNEGSTRTKRCRCGFSIQVEEL